MENVRAETKGDSHRRVRNDAALPRKTSGPDHGRSIAWQQEGRAARKAAAKRMV